MLNSANNQYSHIRQYNLFNSAISSFLPTIIVSKLILNENYMIDSCNGRIRETVE